MLYFPRASRADPTLHPSFRPTPVAFLIALEWVKSARAPTLQRSVPVFSVCCPSSLPCIANQQLRPLLATAKIGAVRSDNTRRGGGRHRLIASCAGRQPPLVRRTRRPGAGPGPDALWGGRFPATRPAGVHLPPRMLKYSAIPTTLDQGRFCSFRKRICHLTPSEKVRA